MRRMNGRTPPFVLVGLVFIILLLAYNYWTLSSQNDDLKKEIDKLQTEVKISGVKQNQFEKKNQILSSNIHDLDEKSERLQLQVEEENQQLKEAKNELKKEEYEITSLKNSLVKKEEAERNLLQQLEEKDNKIEEVISNSQHILSLKNDAEEALAEKDLQINSFKMELEQLRHTLAALQKEKVALRPSLSPGPFNIPNIEKKGPYLARGGLNYVPRMAVHSLDIGLQGIKYHPESQILPRQPSNIPRAKPRFSVADVEKETLNQIQEPSSQDKIQEQLKNGPFYNGNHLESENNVIPNPPIADSNDEKKPIQQHLEGLKKPLEPPHSSSPSNKDHLIPPAAAEIHPQQKQVAHEPPSNNALDHQENPSFINPESNVLPQPPQNHVENPDTAIDDEEKAVEDPSDDQDEEGKEIKRDLENNAVENYDNGDYDEEKIDSPHMNKDEQHNIEHLPHEPQGIGAMEIPRHAAVKGVDENRDDVNLDDDVDQRANERVYETNFDTKIRNLAARL